MALTETLIEMFTGESPDAKALTPADFDGPAPGLHSDARSHLADSDAEKHMRAYGAGLDAIDTVMACLSLIAETASNAEWHLEKDGKPQVPHTIEDVTPDDVDEADQRLVTLIEQPNPWMEYTELLELTIIDFLLVGNAYWLKFRQTDDGKPLALYRLSPKYITIVPSSKNLVEFYEYRVPGKQPVRFHPSEVLHFKRPNPHDEHFGLGLIAGGARMLDIEIAMTDSQARYYEQGTRLSGVLETERTLAPAILTKIRRQFHEMYSGTSRSYQVAALERGLKFRPIQSTAAEAEFRHLAPMSRDRIASLFRVPLPLIGKLDNADRQAVREAQRIFDNKTMRPLLNKLQKAISLGLTQAWGVDFIIDHEYVMPIEDAVELAADVATLPGIRVREVRERLGYDPLGDERDEIVLNLPGADDNDSTVKDRALGSEGGRPPNPENTAAIPEPGEPLPRDAEASR